MNFNVVSEREKEILAIRIYPIGIACIEITDMCCHYQAEIDTHYSSRRLLINN